MKQEEKQSPNWKVVWGPVSLGVPHRARGQGRKEGRKEGGKAAAAGAAMARR